MRLGARCQFGLSATLQWLDVHLPVDDVKLRVVSLKQDSADVPDHIFRLLDAQCAHARGATLSIELRVDGYQIVVD